MGEQELVTALVGPEGIEGAKPVLDALPFPVLLIAEDYRVEWSNRSAKQTYRKEQGTCYEISHGHDRPCDQYDEACPKREALVQLRSHSVYHAHGTKESSELFKVIALPLEGQKILELHVPLDEEVTRDELTGLYTRAFFEQSTGRQLALLERMQKPYSLLILDLDHFKSVNDTLGHLVGDKVLKAAAHALAEAIRDTDTAGRWGGEEFVVFLPGTETEGARVQAERIREAIEALEFVVGDQVLRITVSIGVAEGASTQPVPEVLKCADDALYRAKRGGRNRVEC